MTTTPSGARVFVNGQERGVTPMMLTLQRGMNHQVVFKFEDADDVVVNLNRQFKGGAAIVGNLFSWSLLGIVVDVANGAAYTLSPEDIYINVSGSGGAAAPSGGEGETKVLLMTTDEYGPSRRNAELLESILKSQSIAGHERELPFEYRGVRYVMAIREGKWTSAASVNGELRVAVFPEAKGEKQAHRRAKKQIVRYLGG
jgi:hypothetical protein